MGEHKVSCSRATDQDLCDSQETGRPAEWEAGMVLERLQKGRHLASKDNCTVSAQPATANDPRTGRRETWALSSSTALASVNFTKAAGTWVSTVHSFISWFPVYEMQQEDRHALGLGQETLSVTHTSASVWYINMKTWTPLDTPVIWVLGRKR